jgi:hypothetical protein
MIEFNLKIKALIEESAILKSKFKATIIKNLQNTDKLIKILNTLNSNSSTISKIKSLEKNKELNKLTQKTVSIPTEKKLEDRKSSVSVVNNALLKKNLEKNAIKEKIEIKAAKELEIKHKKLKKKRLAAERKAAKKIAVKKKLEIEKRKRAERKKIAEQKKFEKNNKLLLIPFRKNNDKIQNNSNKVETISKIDNKILKQKLEQKVKSEKALEKLLGDYFHKQKASTIGKIGEPKTKNKEIAKKKEVTEKNEKETNLTKTKKLEMNNKFENLNKTNNKRIFLPNPATIKIKKNNSEKLKNLRNSQQIFTETRHLIKKFIKKKKLHKKPLKRFNDETDKNFKKTVKQIENNSPLICNE